MKVKEINLERFMSADSTEVSLPDTGIVLIVGNNGSGKSMLIEAVAMAAWGESLRGSSPWQPGRSGAVQLACNYGTITRRATSKHSKTVSWSESADDSLTASKAQALLDKVLPPFETWRKTNTYSTSVLDSFSLATDKERKKLLEDVIRLDKFDDALKKAKDALSSAKAKSIQLSYQAQGKEEESKRISHTLRDLYELKAEGTEADLDALRDKARVASKALDAAKIASREADLKLQEWNVATAALNAEKNAALAGARRLASGLCPTCGGDVKAGLREAEQELERVEKRIAEIPSRPDIQALSNQLLECQRVMQEVTQQGIALKASIQRNADLAQRLQTLENQRTSLGLEILDLQSELQSNNQEVALLEVCVNALGLRGVRANLLSGSLAALESGANYWLSRFYPENNVKLRIFMDNDKVCLELSGLAQDVGYKALSEGQKRRVNLALVMALGTLAGYAGGQIGGTIFFDEVLDTLDHEGRETVAAVLLELAQENCIVVISHSQEFIRSLQPTLVYRVENGKYRAVNDGSAEPLPEPTPVKKKGARKKSVS